MHMGSKSRPDRSGEIKTRITTGIIASAYMFLALFVRGWFLGVNLAVVAVLAGGELIAALRKADVRPMVWPYIVFLVTGAGAYFIAGSSGIMIALTLASLGALASCLWRKQVRLNDMMASVLLLLYPLYPIMMMLPILMAETPESITLIYLIFIVSLGADVFAYFIGTFFGKHKLCPNISPHKTIEGAVGGVLGGVALALGIYFAARNFSVPISFIHYPIMGFIGAVAAALGDLVASAIKRQCGVKDYGNFFPGHGGILDRLDGTLFTMGAICGYASLLGWFT